MKLLAFDKSPASLAGHYPKNILFAGFQAAIHSLNDALYISRGYGFGEVLKPESEWAFWVVTSKENAMWMKSLVQEFLKAFDTLFHDSAIPEKEKFLVDSMDAIVDDLQFVNDCNITPFPIVVKKSYWVTDEDGFVNSILSYRNYFRFIYFERPVESILGVPSWWNNIHSAH